MYLQSRSMYLLRYFPLNNYLYSNRKGYGSDTTQANKYVATAKEQMARRESFVQYANFAQIMALVLIVDDKATKGLLTLGELRKSVKKHINNYWR